MARVDELIQQLVEQGGSDLHLKVDSPPAMRAKGGMQRLNDDEKLLPRDTEEMLEEILPEKLS